MQILRPQRARRHTPHPAQPRERTAPALEWSALGAFHTNSIAPTPLMSEEIPVAPASPPVPQSPLVSDGAPVETALSPQKAPEEPGKSGENSEVRIPEPGRVFQPSPRFLLQ